MTEQWEIELERIKLRDAMILEGMRLGIDSIAEHYAKRMCFDHPGMVFPRVSRNVFAEVKAVIVEAVLSAIQTRSFGTNLDPTSSEGKVQSNNN